jgi:hypothetical protein
VKRFPPGILAIRAVNQYRRRDVLPYLALRYYLNSKAARADKWIGHISTDLVLTRESGAYFEAQHFKSETPIGVEYRSLHLPGANEALAEAYLLGRCAQHKELQNPSCVFSYELSNTPRHKEGIFQHYFKGLRNRHEAIMKMCTSSQEVVVQYTDIKRFYPSIGRQRAMDAWLRHTHEAKLPKLDVELGEKLLFDQAAVSNTDGNGLLTGPALSHFIGNLVFRELDQKFSSSLPARYFRYVDDIVLVGSRREVARSLVAIQKSLEGLELELHPEDSDKHLLVEGKTWLEGSHDFAHKRHQVSWVSFVGDLKRFLLTNPEKREEIQKRFLAEGFRIPVVDYSDAIRERSTLENLLYWGKQSWFRRSIQSVTPDGILTQAKILRQKYASEITNLIEQGSFAQGYARKRLIPKLRYRAGRLVHLGTSSQIKELHSSLAEIPELLFHARVMKAVATQSLDDLLAMGTNGAQAAGQVMRAGMISPSLSRIPETEPEKQALAVILLNGVNVQSKAVEDLHSDHQLLRFASQGVDRELMKSEDKFVQEISCLHGLSSRPRHPVFLDTAFDHDEELSVDVVNQLQQSTSP